VDDIDKFHFLALIEGMAGRMVMAVCYIRLGDIISILLKLSQVT